jgi:transcriptional regulator with XRE-family HTH domain
MEIKDILRLEREKRSMTQKQIADYLHVRRESYTLYETGKNIPTTENIMQLADLYKCSTDYLLGRYIVQ